MSPAPNDPNSLQKNAAAPLQTSDLGAARLANHLDGAHKRDPISTATHSLPVPDASWQKPSTWNTRDLPLRVGSDAIAAAASGGLVAPLITIIDRWVAQLLHLCFFLC